MIRVLLQKGRVDKFFLNTLVEKKFVSKKIEIDRKLLVSVQDLELMFVKPDDISLVLDSDRADIAVLGSDVIEERFRGKYSELLDFSEDKCRFALIGFRDTADINVVATKYPNIAKRYLEEMKKQCEIIKLNGSLELYPNIGLCDAIIDLVETGSTLRANGLDIIREFDTISTKIITTKGKENSAEIKKLINKLR